MGVLTDIRFEVDEDEQVLRVFARTKFGISTRANLNRVASRASTSLAVGQRDLVASAYDEEGIELAWREGPFGLVKPEEKFENAKEIEYRSVPMDTVSDFGDILEILPVRLKDTVEFEEFREGEVLHVWEIPTDLAEPHPF